MFFKHPRLPNKHRLLGDILKVYGVTAREVGQALAHARITGCRIGESLVFLKFISQEELDEALALQRANSGDQVDAVLKAMDHAIARTRKATERALAIQKITGEFTMARSGDK